MEISYSQVEISRNKELDRQMKKYEPVLRDGFFAPMPLMIQSEKGEWVHISDVNLIIAAALDLLENSDGEEEEVQL